VTVRDLIELLQKERPTKKVHISNEYALVELKEENIVSQSWGVIIR
jgi:hypothetical protein